VAGSVRFSNDGADCRQCWHRNDDHMRWFGLAD